MLDLIKKGVISNVDYFNMRETLPLFLYNEGDKVEINLDGEKWLDIFVVSKPVEHNYGNPRLFRKFIALPEDEKESVTVTSIENLDHKVVIDNPNRIRKSSREGQ